MTFYIKNKYVCKMFYNDRNKNFEKVSQNIYLYVTYAFDISDNKRLILKKKKT